MSLITFFKNKLAGVLDNGRTGVLVKNVGLGFVAKGLSIIISFIQIPLLLGILNKTEYGIWITIFSVTGWLSFFDIGMGNGFRNQLTEALAVNDMLKAKKLVSTTYLSLAAVFGFILIVFIVISPWVPWENLFNAPAKLHSQLYLTIVISVGASALNFVAGLIHIILASKHQTGKSSLLFLISQTLTLLFIFWYKYHPTNYDFLIMSVVLSVMPLLVNIAINIFFFVYKFREIAPSRMYYHHTYLKSLMNLGIMFFLIQISAIIMYSTDTFIINKLFGPESVTTYSIVYKYFSIMTIMFSIITTPLWTMYVGAYANNDLSWIKSNIKRLIQFVWITLLVLVLMNIAAPFIFSIWVGKSIQTSIQLNVLISIYFLIYIWGNVWVIPLNAAGKIKVQMYFSLFVALLNIPVIILLSHWIHNVNSVVIGNIICLLIGSGSMYFYYNFYFKATKIQISVV